MAKKLVRKYNTPKPPMKRSGWGLAPLVYVNPKPKVK